MKYVIVGKNMEVTQSLKDAVTQKLDKLDKFFSPDTEVHVTLQVNRDRHKIEVTIPVRDNIIRSEQVSNDMYVSIDLVEEVIERQLKKYKSKLIKRHQEAAAFKREYVERSYYDEEDIRIVRKKQFDLKPMYPDDACVQMELLGHNFFVFINAETEQIAVVYTRKGGTYGLSEPEAGSDLAAVRTTAQRADGGFRVNGRKIWTSHAHHATHSYLLARTDKTEKKHEGLTEFVVDMTAEGVSVTPIVDMAGSHHFNEVVFDDVFVPARRVIGVEGNGWRQVTEQLAYERGGPERVLSTYPVLEQLLSGGVDQDDGLLAELGELVSRLATLRSLCAQIAGALDAGEAPVRAAATLKYLGTDFEREVLEFARRATGSGVVPPDSPLGEAIMAAPGFSIRGGSSEVLLSILAKQEAQ